MVFRNPRVACVSFGYPDYPPEQISQMIHDSHKALEQMGIEVLPAPPVITLDDVEAARAFLKHETFDAIVLVLVSWVEAPLLIATVRPYHDVPMVLWSHTTFMEGASRVTLGALPAAGVIRETLEEMAFRFCFVYGMPNEAHLATTIVPFARAASTVQRLATARIGLYGYASMGMYTGTIDHTQLRSQLGPEIDHVDQYLIVERFNRLSDEDVQQYTARSTDWNVLPIITSADMNRTYRMYAAIKSLAEQGRHDALTIKCQYELSRTFGMAPCMPLSMLADEMVVSCEGDLPLVVTQLILHYLTGTPTSYGDLHHVTERSLLLGACGFAPLSFAAARPVINKHTALYEGILNSSPYREGTVTLARLSSMPGGTFKMHIAGGKSVPGPLFHEVGCPPYPFITVELDENIDEFMQRICSQHYAIVYGDVRSELRQLCHMLGVKVRE
jgi:L-fucose isomerase-like protein